MLFKKNPLPMPEFIAFAFFDYEIEPDHHQICTHAQELMRASFGIENSSVELLNQDGDSFTFFIGGDTGVLLMKLPNRYPIDKIDPDDPNRQLVAEAHEHWVFVLKAHDQAINRQREILMLTLLIQAVSAVHGASTIIPSPHGIVMTTREWNESVDGFLNEGVIPISPWVGYGYAEESGRVNAASLFMDELFGLPNIEIIGSPRPPEETVDLLVCGVLESIMNGPIHKSSKQWLTKTGVRYKVKYTKSCYDPSRKATQLVEI